MWRDDISSTEEPTNKGQLCRRNILCQDHPNGTMERGVSSYSEILRCITWRSLIRAIFLKLGLSESCGGRDWRWVVRSQFVTCHVERGQTSCLFVTAWLRAVCRLSFLCRWWWGMWTYGFDISVEEADFVDGLDGPEDLVAETEGGREREGPLMLTKL